jgi:hypothetical protein
MIEHQAIILKISKGEKNAGFTVSVCVTENKWKAIIMYLSFWQEQAVLEQVQKQFAGVLGAEQKRRGSLCMLQRTKLYRRDDDAYELQPLNQPAQI